MFDELSPFFDRRYDTHDKNLMITQVAQCQKIVNNELMRIMAVCGAVDSEVYQLGLRLREDIEKWLVRRTASMGNKLRAVHYQD